MKFLASAVIIVGVCVGLYVLFFVANPYDPAADLREAEALDREIKGARTQQQCEMLAAQYQARLVIEANGAINLDDLVVHLPPPKPNTSTVRKQTKEMVDIFEQNAKAMGEDTLYLLACLKHLVDQV